ncbi:MAG TPA: thiamine pyrophosphate-binding protein [Thermomicrobiaceae bacterium]|nr:thiamine pyrophosphate-binding protein [Thermomicrobiaceae bacterium]
MGEMNGAALLVRALARAGTERIFTLSGNQLLPIYDACLDARIPLTDTRHEAAAAHMADAWARLRGTPGVCLVSAGPGHTNAVTAVANALLAESPVIWISGGSALATRGRGGFQELDQVGIAAPVCKAAWQATSAEEIPALVARAWRTALAGRPGPTHLTVPEDLLAAPVASASPLPEAGDFVPAPRPADTTEIERALDLLAGAARPLILASPSATRGPARGALEVLTATTGIPWLVLESPRALNDPALLDTGRAAAQADAILLVGPQDYAAAYGRPGGTVDRILIQVAPESGELARNAPVEVGLVGDPASVLRQLGEASAERSWRAAAWREQVDALRAAARARFADAARSDDVPIHPLRVAAEVRRILAPGAVVAQDGGEFSQWARWGLAEAEVETLVSGKLAMIGPAIPFAIAGALARPDRPAVAFLGDGTFGFHGMEFDTAVRHGIPFVAVVGNDSAWAAERHRQAARYGEDRVVASDLLPTRYDRVAEGLGAQGILVERPDRLRPALERALASGRPTCVNVMIRSVPSPAAIP